MGKMDGHARVEGVLAALAADRTAANGQDGSTAGPITHLNRFQMSGTHDQFS